MVGERGSDVRLRGAAVAAPRAAELDERCSAQCIDLGALGLGFGVGRIHCRGRAKRLQNSGAPLQSPPRTTRPSCTTSVRSQRAAVTSGAPKTTPPAPPPERCACANRSSDTQVWEPLALRAGVPHAATTWSYVAPRQDSRAAVSSLSIAAQAAIDRSSRLALLGATVFRADLVGADPALFDQPALAERHRTLAMCRRPNRARADRKADADTNAAAASSAEAADADRRPTAVGRAGLCKPRVHLGAVGERPAARRRAPRAHQLVVARADPALSGVLGRSAARGEKNRRE